MAALLQWAQEAPTGVDGLVRSLRELLTPEGLQAAAAALGRIAVVILSAWLLGYLLRRAGDALFGRLQGRRAFFNEARTLEARRLLRALIRLAIWLTAAAAVLETLGVDVRALLREPGLRGYVEALVIILAAHLVIRIGSLLIDQVFEHREAQAQADPRIDPQRAATLRGLLRSVLRYAVDIAAVLTALSHLGFNTSALLASVGVVSIAVGFGAQSLVRDVLAGFFILFEDQFQVGDEVELAGVQGTVEEIGFRVTKIRGFDGALHIIPNGEITRVRNAARTPMRFLVEVRIGYDVDTDRALQVLEEACRRFQGDPRVTSGPTVQGVSSLDESWLTVTILGYARPGQQYQVGRELRLAVKKVMDEAGIQVPYPRTVLVPAGTTAGAAHDNGQVSGS